MLITTKTKDGTVITTDTDQARVVSVELPDPDETKQEAARANELKSIRDRLDALEGRGHA